jgi:hypothetical protein
VVVVMMMVMMVILDEFHVCGRPYLRPHRIFGFQYCKRIRNGLAARRYVDVWSVLPDRVTGDGSPRDKR